MKRLTILLTALLTAALSVLLTGCLFRSTEDLYALPERFPGYEDLTGKRSEIQAGLEMEYGTTVETAVIYSGDNTSVIQFQDMDGDGSQQTVLLRLAETVDFVDEQYGACL